ncbi:hypothetical protein G6711_02790 [Polynucleobacter paneuropaeus]|jgi:hypothetical protein|nr:hypothetical protein [Polynucleobacter paneuropaeus]
MIDLAQDYFADRARKAIALSAKRVSDLRFFEQVQLRLEAGEDLSKEVPAFKAYKKKEAITKVKELVARCQQDLKKGYWTIGAEGITQKVKAELSDAELVPRYIVEYKISTGKGVVMAIVTTKGRNIDVELMATGNQSKQNQAIAEVSKVLMWANIKK